MADAAQPAGPPPRSEYQCALKALKRLTDDELQRLRVYDLPALMRARAKPETVVEVREYVRGEESEV